MGDLCSKHIWDDIDSDSERIQARKQFWARKDLNAPILKIDTNPLWRSRTRSMSISTASSVASIKATEDLF